MTRFSLTMGVLAAVSSLGGCGFIEGHAGPEGDCVVYIGTVRDVEHITGERRHGSSCLDLTRLFVPFHVVDVPISLALDSAVLPFTLFYELVCRPAPKQEGAVPVEKPKIPEEKP